MTAALRTEIFEDTERLGALLEHWDALAVVNGLPYSAPAWQLAWWRHCAPAAAVLRVVAAWDGERLAGIAPFFARPAGLGTWRYALLASPVSCRTEPLSAEADRERCAAAFAAALAGARPRAATITLSQVPERSPWPQLLRAAWPQGAPGLHREVTVAAPVVALDAGDLDAWLAARSSNFRSQVRGARRKAEARGLAVRDAPVRDIDEAVAELLRLHASRWDRRGGSDLPEGVDRMLVEAARQLVPRGRMWLLRIAGEDATVAALLFVAAGGQLAYWNGGFDEEHADLRPGLVTLVEATGRAIAAGCDRLDLGPGDAPYKRRLTDREDALVTWALVAPGRASLRARALVAARHAKRDGRKRLSRLTRRGR